MKFLSKLQSENCDFCCNCFHDFLNQNTVTTGKVSWPTDECQLLVLLETWPVFGFLDEERLTHSSRDYIYLYLLNQSVYVGTHIGGQLLCD